MANKFFVSLGISATMVSLLPPMFIILFMASFLQTSSLYPHQFIDSIILTWQDIEKQSQSNDPTATQPPSQHLPQPLQNSLKHLFRFGHDKGLW